MLPEKEPRHPPGGMKVPLPTTPWDERNPGDGWEVDEDGKIVEKRTPRNMRIPDLTDEELEAEIKDLEKRSRRAKQQGEKLSPHYRRRLTSARIEKGERADRASEIATTKKAVEDAADAAATEEARAKLEKVMMLLASRFKNNPELMSYDEKKRYLDSLSELELREMYKDITGFDAAKTWSRTGPKTPNLVDKIIKSKEPPPKVIDPDELDDDQYRLYLQRLKPGKLYDEASTHLVKNRGKHRKDSPDEFIKLIVAARKERREISDIANMDAEAITAERNALLKGKNPEKLTHEELARIAVLDDALKDGVEDSLMAYMEYLKETKGKLRNDLKKRLKAKPDEAATPKKTPKKTPEPAGPVDDSGRPIPPPPNPADVVPADVVPEDVVPEDVVPEDVVPEDVVPEDVVPDLVEPRETHDPGGQFTWAKPEILNGLTDDELDYEIRRQLSYDAAEGPYDLPKHGALKEEWRKRHGKSPDPLGDETPEERATAIREFQEAMRDEVADEWEAVAEGLGRFREDLDTDVLPDFKLWSDGEPGFEEKEKAFGKYYHVSGELNDRGVLLNERIVGKEEDDEPEIPEDEAAIVEQIEAVDDAVEKIQETARDRREPTPSPVPDDPRFTPTVEEGDIRISENVIVHSSNTDDDVRPMLLVQMPDGTIQAFYKRTGSGSEATPGEVEQIEAEGGGGAGNWVPFDGFGGRLGKNWFRKGESDPQEGGPLFRYGTEELKAAGQALDASENVQAMLDDPDRQVHIVHSDPSRVGGELMLDPDDPTIQKTSEELNEILGLPSTEEYTASLVKPKDVDVPKVRIESWDNLGQEGFEYRIIGQNAKGHVLVEKRGGEGKAGFYRVKPKPDQDGEYYDPRFDREKLDAGDRAAGEEAGWTFFDETEWTSAVPRTSPKRDVPEDVPEPDEVSPGAVVPEPEAATPKPKQPSVPEFRVSVWDRLNDGTEYRVVLYSEEENKAVIERRGGKGRAGFYMLQPGKREGDYDATWIRDFSSDRRDAYVGRTFRSIDAPWPDGASEEAPEKVPVQVVAGRTASEFWTELPEGLSAEDVNKLIVDKRQERVDKGELPDIEDARLDEEIMAEIVAEHTAPKPKAEPKKPKVKPKPKVVSDSLETPASLAEIDDMQSYFFGEFPSMMTPRDIARTMKLLRDPKLKAGKSASELNALQNRIQLFETHQTLTTGKPIEVITAMNALLRQYEESAVDAPEWELRALRVRMDEAIRALEGREGTEPPEVTQRRELLEKRREVLDDFLTAGVIGKDPDAEVLKDPEDADVPDSTLEFDLTREELERLLQADQVTGKKKDEIVAILLDMTDDLDSEDLKKMTVKQLKELIKEEKAKSRAALLKLVEDERDNGRTLGVDERSSNAQIIDALLDTTVHYDDDPDAIRPETARLDADRGDVEVPDESVPVPVDGPPQVLLNLREEVADLADLEARITNLSDDERKRHLDLRVSVSNHADDLADLEAAEAQRLRLPPKPKASEAAKDRATAIADFHAETAGVLSEEKFEEWLDARKAAKPAERSAKGDRRTANAEELRALRAEYQAKRATERGKFRRIWEKLKAMTKADRRLVKLDRESSEEKKDRLARVQVLRAKNVLTADEKLELRDLEDVEAAQVVNPMMRGAEQTRVKAREELDRLTWEDANGVSSSLEDLSDEELVKYRELPEDTAKQTLSFTGGFVLLLDRSDARDGPVDDSGKRKVNKDRGVWRLALNKEEGKADGLKKRTKRAAAAQIEAMKAARKAGKSESDVFAEGAVARATVEQEDIVPSTHRVIKRTEIKEILMELEDALRNKLLAEAGIDIDERVTTDSKWASEFGMSPKGGTEGNPVLIERTGTTAGRKAKIPARYVDGSEEGTTKQTRTLDAVTLDDGEVEAVGAALEDYPVDVVLEVLPSTPFWDVPEDGAVDEDGNPVVSEDDPATVELFSRYYSETADEGLFLNDRGLWVNNVLNGLADPSEVKLEEQSAEIPAVEASPRLLLSDAKRFVTTGKRKPDSEPRDDIVKNLEEGKGEGGPKSAFKKRMIEVPKDRAEIDSMVRLLDADKDADNPYESDRGDPPLAGAAGDDRIPPQWGNVARRGARNVKKGNRKSKTVQKAIEEAARRKREEGESLPPPVPVAEDNPDQRLQEIIKTRDSRVAAVLPRLDEFPEFDDGTEEDSIKRVVRHSTAAKKEADFLRVKKEAFDADALQPYSEEEEERLEKLEEYEKALTDARNSILAVKGRLRTLSASGREDPPLAGAAGDGFRPSNWDDGDRERREIFEAEFRETMAGMTLDQVQAIADGKVVWSGPDPFDDQRATIRLLRNLAGIEARRRRAEAFPVSEPEAPMSRDDRLRKILTDMGVSDEMADDPLFREFAMLTAVTGRDEKDPTGDDPLSEETIQLLKGWVGPDAEAKMDAAIAAGRTRRSGHGIEWIGLARLSGNFDWKEFSRSRGYTDGEIQDFAMWLEVKDEIDEKYPVEGTSPHPETGEPVPWASTSEGFIYELGVAQKTWIDGAPKESTGLAEMWTEDLQADWKRARGMHAGEWPVNPKDEEHGRRTVENTLVQGPGWPPGLNPQGVGELSLEELQVLGTEILKAIRFNTFEDEGIAVNENERAAHLRHSLHTLNNELLEDVLNGVYTRLEREADGFERGSDDPGYLPIRPRSDDQVEWDRMAEDMKTWTEEQWSQAADEAAESMVGALRDWLEANPDENPLRPTATGDRDSWVPGKDWTPERRRAIANARRQDLERRDPEYAETVAMHRELVREMSDEVLRAEVDRIVALPAVPPDERDGYINVLEELGERADRKLRHEQNLPPEGADIRTAITEDDGEYTVRLFIDGVHQAGADHFTDDPEEAEETAKAMEADAHISDKTTESAEDEASTFDELEIDGRSIPLSLDWADDPEVQRLHDAMYPPEKALYYGETRSDALEAARQYDPNSEEAIIYETQAATLVEAEFLTDAQIDEQILLLVGPTLDGDPYDSGIEGGYFMGILPATFARPPEGAGPEVVGRITGLQSARIINFTLKEEFAKREMRIRADDMSVDELNALIQRLESEPDTGMLEMVFNGIVLFGDDDKYLLHRRIDALKEMAHYKQNMDPHGEVFWDDDSGTPTRLPSGIEREVGPYPFILTDEGDLVYLPNLTEAERGALMERMNWVDSDPLNPDLSVASLMRENSPRARADALVDMLKRLKAHQGELDPDMYQVTRKRHINQLVEAIGEMPHAEQDEFLAGLGNFFNEMGIAMQWGGEGDGLDLSGHDLPERNWTNTDFAAAGADPDRGFKEANFGGSNLSRGDFRGVDLRGADFRGTDLSEVDFTGADLRGANFDGANLAGVNFTGANMEGVIWGNSTPDDNTIWPDDGYPGFDPDPPLVGGVPRGPNTAGRGGPLRDRRGRFIDRVFDPDADYTFEDLAKWTKPELAEAARSLGVAFADKPKKELIEDILERRPARGGRAPVGGRGTANAEPSLLQKLDMLRNQYRNAETIGDQDEMDRIADELRGLGSRPIARRRKTRPQIDRGDPPLAGAAGGNRRGVERTSVNEAMERYDSLGLEELNLEVFRTPHSPQRLRDLMAARGELYAIQEDPTLPRGLRDQARGDIRDLTAAIHHEEAMRRLGVQRAWSMQHGDNANDLLERAIAAVKSGDMKDLDANWEEDVEDVIAAWTGPGPTPLLGGGYTQSGPDDRPNVLISLQAFRDNISQYKSALWGFEGVEPLAQERMHALSIFPEEEGYVADEDVGGIISELQSIEEVLADIPYLSLHGPSGDALQEKRDILIGEVRTAIQEALHRERDVELGPLGDIEGWTGDDLDGSTSLLSTGIRPRPAGLGIAGDVVDGFVRGKRVPIGHKGMKTRHQAAVHVRSGGDISDVPDEFLTHALLTNSSRHPGERFLEVAGTHAQVSILRQRINQSPGDSGEPDVYGQEGFVLKASSGTHEIVSLVEWAAAEVLHNLGFPVLPYRMSGPNLMDASGVPSDRGITVVMEFAWNGHPIGELLSPDYSSDGFDVSDFHQWDSGHEEVGVVGLEGRLMNWLARMLLNDMDGHNGNAISAHAPDGTAGVVPIDLEGGFDAGSAVSTYGSDDLATSLARIFHSRDISGWTGFYMDPNWRRDVLDAIDDNPELEQRFDTIIRTAIERFRMMLGDPNWVERLASVGPYSDLPKARSLVELREMIETYSAEMLPRLGNVDGIVDAILGRVDGEEIVDTDPSVKEFDPSSDKMLAVVDYINTCLESAA